jgi:FkbM family methyltransferase
MSQWDRAVGLARSIAVYHGIPLRRRRMQRLYAQFVTSGDLVFDIGAHAGNRVRGFAALGCRVVALEPQPDFARLLRTLFARSRHVAVVEMAVGEAAGRAVLSVSERTPTVTTLVQGWREARTEDPDFAKVRWNRRVEVETTTLDLLIARFGMPSFVKVDVEGGEPAVFGGLSRPVPALSFEYLPRALDQVEACLARLSELGRYGFNWSPGESYRLESPAWLSGQELIRELSAPEARRRSGDVYARLMST